MYSLSNLIKTHVNAIYTSEKFEKSKIKKGLFYRCFNISNESKVSKTQYFLTLKYI